MDEPPGRSPVPLWRAVATVVAVLALAAVAGWAAAGGGGFDVAWLPSWGARLAFELDGLGRAYALLATGIGVAVIWYASAYLPRHLAHEGRPQSDGRPGASGEPGPAADTPAED